MTDFQTFAPFLQVIFGVNLFFGLYSPLTYHLLNAIFEGEIPSAGNARQWVERIAAPVFRNVAVVFSVIALVLLYFGGAAQGSVVGRFLESGAVWIWVLALPLPVFCAAARRWSAVKPFGTQGVKKERESAQAAVRETPQKKVPEKAGMERREFARIKSAPPYRVEYNPIGAHLPKGSTECVNISRGGMALPVCLPENTHLELVIRFTDGRKATVEGTVVWSTPAKDGSAPFSGILLEDEIDLPLA